MMHGRELYHSDQIKALRRFAEACEIIAHPRPIGIVAAYGAEARAKLRTDFKDLPIFGQIGVATM